MIMIPLKKRFYQLSTFFKLVSSIVMPAQTLFPDRAVEAFYVGLLVLTIRPGDTVTVTEG
jgi:hypothetical protein